MKKLIMLVLMSGLLAFNLTASGLDSGKEIKEFNNQITKAYADYRMALFQTSKKDSKASLKFAQQFSQKWQIIRDQYQDNPPAVYALDPLWKSTVASISRISLEGVNEVKQNELEKAHETLEAIRDLLGDLRKRNNTITFSDHVNKYHEQMEAVLSLKLSDSISSDQLKQLREYLAVLDYLMAELKDSAPKSYLSNSEFNKLLKGNFSALANLRKAIDNESNGVIKKAISLLKPAYAKLFVKFG